jgi:hypothetical protein
MIQTLSTYQAADLLCADAYAKWDRLAALALVEYLEELEGETGTPIEFDAVAIRCDYSVYESALEAATEFGFEADEDEDEDEDEREESALAWLQDQTQVIEFEGGVVVAAF